MSLPMNIRIVDDPLTVGTCCHPAYEYRSYTSGSMMNVNQSNILTALQAGKTR
jgi:hypothetical protein